MRRRRFNGFCRRRQLFFALLGHSLTFTLIFWPFFILSLKNARITGGAKHEVAGRNCEKRVGHS